MNSKWIKLWFGKISPEAVAVVAFFFIATCFLTNFVILHINSQLFTAGVGDATSGFLWLLYADKGWDYFHTHTTLVNFPYGENLWSPVYVTWTMIMAPLWLLSKFISPIAAMNVMMFVGFMSGGIAGYYLIKRLTKNWLISLMGGYAIAFVSYHIMKGVDHFTNIFAWVFVAIIGCFIAFWRRPTIVRGILLAAAVAAACYTDGYYIYVAGVLVAALFMGAILSDVLVRRAPRAILGSIARLCLVGVAALILMAPIIATQFTSHDQITADLSNSRDDIKKEINYYSSKPIDFLLPVSKNITVSQYDWYQQLLIKKNSRSNDGENSTYIGYVVLSLYVVGVYYAYRIVRARVHGQADMKLEDFTLVTAVIAVPLMMLWMAQPELHLFGMKVYMPTELLVRYIPYWRVPARLFVALHPVLVVVACLALARLVRGWTKRKTYIVVGILFGLMAIEYYTNIKRPSFGLANMPATYSWIAQQPDIHSLVELPLVDRPIEIAGYAVFAQLIHHKPIVNSALAKEAPGLFNPLATAQNIETIHFLQDRGVDTVLIHSRVCNPVPWGDLIHAEYNTYVPSYVDPQAKALCTYHLQSQKPTDSNYIYAKDGFEAVDAVSAADDFELRMKSDVATLTVVNQDGRQRNSGQATLQGIIHRSGQYAWQVEQAGRVAASGVDDGEASFSAELDTAEPVKLYIKPIDTSGGVATLSQLQVF